jgi:hypothetical protein
VTFLANERAVGRKIEVLTDLILRGVGVDIVYTIEYGDSAEFEWDDQKNRSNFQKTWDLV